MRATSPSRPAAPARVQQISPNDRSVVPVDGQLPPPTRRAHVGRFAVNVLLLALIWGGLTDWRVDALVFGVPAVLLGAMIPLLLPYRPIWRLSLTGALRFALWFAVQSFRGATDVAWRAFAPHLPLRPGFRSHPLTLPHGAPQVMFINTITLLPGTLSAEVQGDRLIVHMLDTRADLAGDLAMLETRIRALFALPTEV